MKTGILLAAAVAALAWTGLAEIPAARRAECAKRAAELVSRMSAEERVGQLMMDSPAIERLGVPPYHWWNEALHGVARAGLATVFPQSMGLAASFDADLGRRIGDVVSTEARAKCNLFRARGHRGIYCGLTFWSPNVNMFRDPRWGRGQETFGEDPFLSGAMGGAFVRGVQGDDPRYLKAAACAKHYAVHSGPERLRHGFDAKVPSRDLREYYLPAFRALAADAKVEAFMGAYNAVNGVPCCANRMLLTDILRGEWGFAGHVVSDVGAVRDVETGHHFRTNTVEACLATIAAGLDLCSEKTYEALLGAVRDGRVGPDLLAAPLTHLFTTRMLLGEFDPPGSTPWDGLGAADVASAEHRALALEAAEKTIVLVSNNGTLPLDAARTSVLGLVGPYVTSTSVLRGNYSGYSSDFVSCEEGFVGEAGPGVRVVTEETSKIDTIVACVGISPDDEGEETGSIATGGDRARYGIAPGQLRLLRDHKAKGHRVIAVVFGGSPVDLAEIVATCDAVLLAWYPGEQGGRAVARTVFGRSNPGGRLPITCPRSYDDLPDISDYALAGRTYRYATAKPAYPFGYGLSYTTFAYSALDVRRDGDAARVSVRVRNSGAVAGDEVVQAYVRAPAGSGDRRLHHLEGFARVRLAPGEERTVTLTLAKDQFAVYGEDGRAAVPAGSSRVFVGGGQPGFAACLSAEVAW